MGPVLLELARRRGVRSLVCVTGQHRELVRRPLELFGVKPDFDLKLMRRNQEPAQLAAEVLAGLTPVLRRTQPDWVLAAGDTTSVLGAALAAAHARIRFGHIEAGLRTDERMEPFPEEFNRRVAAVLADLHFAPNERAYANLRRENLPARTIVVTGNPIIDAVDRFALKPAVIPAPLAQRLGLNARRRSRLAVVTFHRRENIGLPMREICAAVRQLALKFQGALKILCIVHPNPAVREPANKALADTPHVILAKPVEYPVMLALLRQAAFVLTDSGGLQEEAPYLGVPVLVLRNVTERPEGVEAGVARLVGTSCASIVAETSRVLGEIEAGSLVSRRFTGYGDGHAARRIVAALMSRSAQQLPIGTAAR